MTIIQTHTQEDGQDPNPTGDTPNGVPVGGQQMQEGQQTPPAEGEPRLFAGKYKSVEELEKGYSELRAKLSAGGDKPPENQTPPEGEGAGAGGEKPSKEIPTGEGAAPTAEDAYAIVEKAGLKWDDLYTQYAESGNLSDEQYETLKKSGWPRQVVDTFIRGRQAEVDQYDNAVFEAAGGKDDYAKMIDWAKGSLTPAEAKAFNDSITSGNIEQARLAVKGLNARFAAEATTPPGQLLNGKGGGTGGARPFQSNAEMTAAMNDRRYRNDPAYRKQVLDRLAVSDILN